MATAHASQYLLSPYPIALPALTELTRERARIADRLVETKVSEVMTTDPVTVSPDDDLAAAASVMCDKGVHRVLVTDNGRLVGLLSSLDLAGTLIEG